MNKRVGANQSELDGVLSTEFYIVWKEKGGERRRNIHHLIHILSNTTLIHLILYIIIIYPLNHFTHSATLAFTIIHYTTPTHSLVLPHTHHLLLHYTIVIYITPVHHASQYSKFNAVYQYV
ncbi:uncharacterized protein Smp_200600 [Schistosoma mansoni]|uniref:Smp_200600 n=1 Tax=Schistosoma mansoni TaxID=6183 RepID=G4V7L9_SCHMA|nr:uncharacterized protein Smp_200600 [Schistosoma mansoni]|eukprot:XP_018647810.1 uncharacterized protein Smp_200600 [Schistosoma mansoni]